MVMVITCEILSLSLVNNNPYAFFKNTVTLHYVLKENIAAFLNWTSLDLKKVNYLELFILKSFRSLVADEEQFAGSEVNIRQGVLENVAAALDPAFPELAEQSEEHRSIFQV